MGSRSRPSHPPRLDDPKPKAKPGTASYAVDVALIERFPCGKIPVGEQTKIAAEFGVTRQLVQKRAARLGMARLPPTRHFCAGCGQRPPLGRRDFCRDCLWVELPCAYCGRPVRRLASQLASQYGRSNPTPRGKTATSRGRVFCSRRCQGKWLGERFGGGRRP